MSDCTMIREMAPDDRPRERLASRGPAALSPAELLAIILRTGRAGQSATALAQQVLSRFDDGIRGLSRATVDEIRAVAGIGPVKAIEIAAAIEIGRRCAACSPLDRPRITGPADVEAILGPLLRSESRERFVALLLDTKHRVLRMEEISVGTLDSSIVHPREVFRPAVAAAAAGVIVAHNHPSGDPTPSPEDIRVTLRLKEAGAIVGIDVVDHVVLGATTSVSLKQRGVL